MYINIGELIHLVRKRHHDKLYVSQPFGSAIRYRRKELNMTLEEASEDICCVSYLSKVENNMIQASEDFVQKFRERFNLVEKTDDDLKIYEQHLNIVTNACLKGNSISKEMFIGYQDLTNYQSVILNLACYVLNKQYDDAKSTYKQLVTLIFSMPQESFMVSMLLVNCILYHYMHYLDGMHILRLIEKQEPYSKTIKLIIQKMKLKHALKLGNSFLVYDLYYDYTNELIKKQLFSQVQDMHTKRYLFQSRFRLGEDMSKELNKVSEMDEKDKELILSRSFYFNGQPEKSLALSLKHYHLSNDWLIHHLLVLDKLKLKDKIISTIEEVRLYTTPSFEIIKRHLVYKYTKNQEEVTTYIRREILTKSFVTDDKEILSYLMKDCEQLLTKYQYYKDAVLVYRMITNKIEKLNYA